jgi:5'-3' exonuclease|tara:strand:+ start:15017 stop:16609 length:1593 start_codon:yes stop_codon:yes gene_type:complete
MGIPSYFSYIVKNHPEIIKKIIHSKLNINNLYMDCNSIIYDVIHTIDDSNPSTEQIISKVIGKIEEYITIINPNNKVILAFDGVAPVAKLEQQRTRRFRSNYLKQVNEKVFDKNQKSWDTTAITPGTNFMNELNISMNTYFKNHQSNIGEIIISGSNEPGEGEHKIFQYIRDHPTQHKNETTIIYGLDADLIMLSINHLPISKHIYLFRETPEFIKSIDKNLEPNENYLLDIPELASIITTDMNNGSKMTNIQQNNRIYDYIFLCFFLGNDFLPHFPAANIRTGGIDKLLNAYKHTVGKLNENLTDGTKIYWKNLRKIVSFMAENEEQFIQTETKLRDKRQHYFFPTETPQQKMVKFDAIPTYERKNEKFINPFKEGWRERYYKSLFNIDIDDMRTKQICLNYMQGLEWTMKYYTTGCVDWRWCYQYNYPPLFQDLIKYMPFFDTEFVKENSLLSVHPLVQLSYVLPRSSLDLLPKKLYDNLMIEHQDKYPSDCEFVWSYCRYFWECHIQLPELDINELEKYVHKIMSKK